MRAGILICLLVAPMSALSQAGDGSIRGVVTGPQDELVPYMWLRAKTSGDQVEAGRAETTEDGPTKSATCRPASTSSRLALRAVPTDGRKSRTSWLKAAD